MKAPILALVLVLPSAALAGGLDQSRYLAPLVDPAPVYTWTGLSLGVSLGGVTYEDRLSGATIADDTNRPTGGLAGVSLGYAFQTEHLVTGIETDLAYTRAKGTTTNGSTTHSASLESFGSTRLRFGYGLDRIQFYVAGGVAYALTHTRETTGTTYAGNWSLRPGWTVGGGIEYLVTPQWSVRAEGLYAGLGLKTAIDSARHDFKFLDTLSMARAGVSYKF